MKKSVICSFVLLLVSLVYVAADFGIQSLDPNGITWLSPSTLYEFTAATVDIRFNTPNSNLLQANVSTDGVIINSILDPSSGCSINSDNTSCNTDFQILSINISGLSVNRDTSYSWDIAAIDNESGLVVKILNVTVLNDSLPPRYTLNAPLNYSIHKKNETVLFNVTIVEDESGLRSAAIAYNWDSSLSTPTINGYEELIPNSGYFTRFINLENNDDAKNYFAFFFNITDNAGNSNAQQWKYLFVDHQPPTITLNSPTNNITISTTTLNYGFNISDNSFESSVNGFNPQVNCTLYINGTAHNYTMVSSNSSITLGGFLGNLADGSYSWHTVCVDTAGWSTTSESRTFTLDTTGPLISIVSPLNGSVIRNGTTVNLSIIDTYSLVNSVTYSVGVLPGPWPVSLLGDPYDLNTAGWLYGENTLLIWANDSLGNPSNATFQFAIDNQPPTIQLLSPANNSFTNIQMFTFNATDGYSTTLECDLVVDGSHNLTASNVLSGSAYTFNSSLPEGLHLWSVWCQDGVGNFNESEPRSVTIDTIAPVVTLLSPFNVLPYAESNTNAPSGVRDFNYTVNESNNVDSCSLYINNSFSGLVSGAGNFSSIAFASGGCAPCQSPQNVPYVWNVTCNDTAGNKGMSSGYLYYDTLNPSVNTSTVSSTSSSVLVSWAVDEVSNNTIYYGMNSSNLSLRAYGSIFTASPSITLSDLSSSTTYFYVTSSCDQFLQCSNTSMQNVTTSAEASSGSGSSGGGGGGGGGGGSTSSTTTTQAEEPEIACNEDWACADWSNCNSGIRTRTCQDGNACGTSENKPIVTQTCKDTNEKDSDGSTTSASDTALNSQAGTITDDSISAGVGQAVGLFEKIKHNGKAIVAAVGLLGLLGLAGWKQKIISSRVKKITSYQTRRGREEEEEQIRQKLREAGILKDKD
ncbi:hypothetical protein J4228_02705 [Candidatus Woesearchaeota archaeon]|nr:hypothetical protein [Candidatus Woesearchaeota archaeon]